GMSKQSFVENIEPQTEPNVQKSLEKYDTESRYRVIHVPWMVRIISFLSVGLALFHLITSYTGPMITLQHLSLHTYVIMALEFLLYPSRKNAPREWETVIVFLLAILSIATIVYIFVDYAGIVQRAGLSNHADILFSCLMVMLVLEGG